MRKTARLPLEVLAPYLTACDPPDSQLDWRRCFGNDRPIEIEVGCGKGAFLVSAAEAHPETNFLGIEVLRGLQLYIATRLAKRNLSNARIMCTDARRLFHFSVPSASVQAVHVYFPDPWWKKRHHKRRVWTEEFADHCVRALTPGGRLVIATDVSEYDSHIRKLLDGKSELSRRSSNQRTGEPDFQENLTNFERKALQRGGSVFRAEYHRTIAPASSSILHAP